MSERTRLDEIVDEALAERSRNPFDFREACGRIAERAFRYCVERAASWPYAPPVEHVHPAPATSQREGQWACGAHPFFSGLIDRGKQCAICCPPGGGPVHVYTEPAFTPYEFRPPVPRFEHLGEHRLAHDGEYFLDEAGVVRYWNVGCDTPRAYWILRKVAP